MVDFSGATDRIYTMWGQSATHKTGSSAAGTSCTVLFDEMGDEQAPGDYSGIVATARVIVRKAEIAAPGRGQIFDIDGTDWRVEYLLGGSDGTNELETACACIRHTHYGPIS